jgi:Uma2 family endonuclease
MMTVGPVGPVGARVRRKGTKMSAVMEHWQAPRAVPPAPVSGEWTVDDLARLPDDGGRYEIIDGCLLMSGEWTVDDLARLPDDGRRYEIIDGSLLMVPPPSGSHQLVADWLRDAFRSQRPDGFVVLENVGLRVSAERLLVPDLSVIALRGGTLPEDERGQFVPRDVPLVVEIVSPSSVAMDRVTKPRLYAEAGIGRYWRVERDVRGPTVHLHALAGEEYAEVGVVGPGESRMLGEPWAITLEPPSPG